MLLRMEVKNVNNEGANKHLPKQLLLLVRSEALHQVVQ